MAICESDSLFPNDLDHQSEYSQLDRYTQHRSKSNKNNSNIDIGNRRNPSNFSL